MAFKKIKQGTLLAPVPAVLVSTGHMDNGVVKDNLITIAWAGTVCSDPPMVSISIRKERHSYHQVMESGEYVIHLVGEGQLKATDYCGVKSGRNVDKFADCNLTRTKAEGMDYAPAVEECPLYLSCKVKHTMDLGSHTMFIAEIVGMGVQDYLIEENGRINLAKANLVAYAHGTYRKLGEALGFFGHSVASKETLERRMRELRQ